MSEHAGTRPPAAPVPRPAFSHESEALFADLLDFYGVAWDYEPRSFDIASDAQGRVTERFTPDFYLPADDVYVELTTMERRLVTRKHRKLRKLAQSHPDVRCKLMYRSDIERLAAKHGLRPPTRDFTARPAAG